VSGLNSNLVPIAALAVRLCRYKNYEVKRPGGATVTMRLVGSGFLSGSSARQLEDMGNRLPLTRGSCLAFPGTAIQFFFLTFANTVRSVYVEEEYYATHCSIGPTNGTWGGGESTAHWRNELLRDTSKLRRSP
jgi:hypothetical protein